MLTWRAKYNHTQTAGSLQALAAALGFGGSLHVSVLWASEIGLWESHFTPAFGEEDLKSCVCQLTTNYPEIFFWTKGQC